VIGGSTVDEAAVRSLLGVPQGEIRLEIADVVAVGDLRGAFEAIDRLVQAGHDLRNVTGDLLAHFRNLLLVQTAPDQEDLLDIPSDAYAALRAQADKFTPAELSRVLDLLLAAQTDMRWTTSPRLTLELALVRACAPETDPTPAGVVGRLERLERLANVAPGSEVPPADATAERSATKRSTPETIAVVEEQPAAEPVAPADQVADQVADPVTDRVVDTVTEPAAAAEPVVEIADAQLPVPQAADAASVDVAMLRRSWGALIQHLGQRKQMVLRALMESATPTAYDGTTLEIAFPPSFRNTVKQAETREAAFQQVLQEMFGISPAISCVVRGSRSGEDVAHVEPVEEDDAPGDDAEALRRVQEMLGAEPLSTGDGA
jgi:DNA polymerase-3 subunit gamma/tau